MHILLIHQYFLEDQAGGGSRWNEMSRIWIEEGHTVTVLAGMGHYMHVTSDYNGGRYFLKQTNRDGVKVVRCYVSNSSDGQFLSRVFAQFSFLFSAVWGCLFYARDKYDIVLCTSPPLFAGVAGLLISWIKGVDFVLEIRDLWPESAIETGVLQNKTFIRAAFWLERFLYKKAKAINVLTPAFETTLIEQKRINPGKLWLIPNASDFKLSDEVSRTFDRNILRKELGWEGRFVVIYVGAHGMANHLIQIIETAELLQNTAAHFMLIGDGAEKAYLMEETKRRNLNNVRFKDTVSKANVFKYILAADAGASVLMKTDVFKTVYSNKTFDYFACRKPVLLAIDGVSRELVEAADAGMFVEPENPKDFAEKILIYLKNPARALRHGSNGHAYAREHFDREFLAREYLKNIQKLLE
ncbi:glycosyltransferase family 4 protein [Dyadobacter chenwenxiniae]|uniref:Glycosyltransferase family 4 protein n=1 Tax=Dyadobacter chenwenxiniae TaxID=2906456 RepID=A0A9X1TDK0_9BACT|nr:glycosyltransferase family 4 protein [Dyadobacter chenwenxiniae]MCF0061991.1 glycosyltransferase family 4 protein [Dyadobacter chenwenxiniae]UON81802.1 glycosyltransferase family 4 protein [Dyadobacter chenwenxiniae]